jgi:hypothetical protein
MMGKPTWELLFLQEIQQAETARTAGKEGMARVCARRAAGIVIGEYLRRNGLSNVDSSAYDRLRYLYTLPEISPQTRLVISHLLTRVTPDHSLPLEVDLIAETRWLKNNLLSVNK